MTTIKHNNYNHILCELPASLPLHFGSIIKEKRFSRAQALQYFSSQSDNQDVCCVVIWRLAYTMWIRWQRGHPHPGLGRGRPPWDFIMPLGIACYLELRSFSYFCSFPFNVFAPRCTLGNKPQKLQTPRDCCIFFLLNILSPRNFSMVSPCLQNNASEVCI